MFVFCLLHSLEITICTINLSRYLQIILYLFMNKINFHQHNFIYTLSTYVVLALYLTSTYILKYYYYHIINFQCGHALLLKIIAFGHVGWEKQTLEGGRNEKWSRKKPLKFNLFYSVLQSILNIFISFMWNSPYPEFIQGWHMMFSLPYAL